ncbi:MAG: ribokinase [Clostridia bacterium]|nr:ribokinase [Clostridia bacterium]
MKKIYVVGSINTDLVIKTPYMPKQGETLTGEGFFTAHGGKGANQAVAATRLGGEVIMCGCVGKDHFGEAALQALQDDKVDVGHIRVVNGKSTGTAVIIVADGDNRIILDRGANASLTRGDIDSVLETAEAGDIYLTQLENPIDVIGYGIKKAREKGLFVILNPAPADKAIEPYLSDCNLITPNETEVEILGGRERLLQKAEALLITLGSRGFEISTRTGSRRYPCMKIQPIDTTAAGDTLCGGLAAMLAEGKTLEEAAKFGSRAASIACTRTGAQPSIPTRTEVNEYEG